MRITVDLNDREAMKVTMIRDILKCGTGEALSIIIAACKRRAIMETLQMFKIPEEEPEVHLEDEDEPLELE